MIFKRIILIVLDSVGIGEMDDAGEYGDAGSNTLGNLSKKMGGLKLPTLEKMGLGCIEPIVGVNCPIKPIACYGKMREASKGKDTTVGHWEIMGLIIDKPFPLYPKGFPAEIINRFEKLSGRKVIGNKTASGTEIIKELGEHHFKTGDLIVYTSADSVFQIAAHEEVVPLQELYNICSMARKILVEPHDVSRVIARPFRGAPGNFYRTANRHDYSYPPPEKTVLDMLVENKIKVTAIGKIEDIFAGKGITTSFRTNGNEEGTKILLSRILEEKEKGLIFINLVDFDMLYGHRNDEEGYARALQQFDVSLSYVINEMEQEDLLIISADHGCDPTTSSTDHSREHVPLIVYSKKIKKIGALGIRDTFADIGATIAENFNIDGTGAGKSFLGYLF